MFETKDRETDRHTVVSLMFGCVSKFSMISSVPGPSPVAGCELPLSPCLPGSSGPGNPDSILNPHTGMQLVRERFLQISEVVIPA